MPPTPAAHRKGVDGMWVPLLPKLRGHFAEFLNHSSLVRLGILYLTTCVGLGYGPCMRSLEAFLDSIGSRYFASIGYASGLRSTRRRIYLPTLPTPLHQYYHSLATLPSCVTPSLDYYRIGSRAPHKPNRSRAMVRAVSITGLVIGAPSRVREYQPVVHRLRLSASP